VNAALETRRTAIVTGAGRGIGRATALQLAANGCDVVVADILDAGADVAAEIEATGANARYLRTDVTDPASVTTLVAETVRSFGSADILVAAAGVLGAEHAFADLPLDEFHRVLAVNLTGVMLCCRAVLPHMVERGYGRIVGISSGARAGAPLRAPYAVSKAGVVALVNTLAFEYARAGILANCIDPGTVVTDMVVPRRDPEYVANPPGLAIGRLADARETARVIAFLCSEHNTYAVGALWEVTGGYVD
jgi:3-oxoacyl-[acyl-carrier protein] reductase